MKRLFIAFASLALVSLLAFSCKDDEPEYKKTIKITPTELTVAAGEQSEALEIEVIDPEEPVDPNLTEEQQKALNKKKVSQIKWFISDEAVANINTRTLKIEGLKEGTCTITARLYDNDRNVEATTDIKITVTAGVEGEEGK